MQSIIQKHATFWKNKHILKRLFAGILLLAGSFILNYYANIFATKNASNAIADILLDRIPTIPIDMLYTEATLIFIVIVFIVHFRDPHWIPFTLKSVALFIVIRSFAMILTHIAPPDGAAPLDLDTVSQKFSGGADLFFSGHTGIPFLFALMFWHKKPLRWLFLFFTAAGGTLVLLGKLHYSIDVFSAFFITFGIFEMARYIFKKDYALGIAS